MLVSVLVQLQKENLTTNQVAEFWIEQHAKGFSDHWRPKIREEEQLRKAA